MKEITQIRKLSLWIFFVPLIAINLCLFITVNYHLLENTIFVVDEIGRSGFTIPYIDGSLSISRASRTYPAFLIFKPGMILTSFLLYFYWKKNNELVGNFNNISNKNYNFKTFGILSAIFLAIHALLLGVDVDVKIFKLLRRIILLSFIIFEITAQFYLVITIYSLKEKIFKFISVKVLKAKLVLVTLLIIVAVISIPIISMPGNTHLKHALEWDYFLGVIMFYLLTFFMWKKQ